MGPPVNGHLVTFNQSNSVSRVPGCGKSYAKSKEADHTLAGIPASRLDIGEGTTNLFA
jgi:hypothetical protein